MTNAKIQRKDVPSDKEIDSMTSKADEIKNDFFRLRAKATVALLETGKRRSELASLEKNDITTDTKYLYVRFTVVKKRKKNISTLQRTKKFDKDSRFAKMIIEYLDFLNKHFPNCKYIYPSGKSVFGLTYSIDPNKHLKGQEIWRIIKALNPNDWPHLHRERRAVKVIRADEARFGEAKLETVYRVKNVLDLERENTAYNYIRRHETQKVEEQEEVLE